MTHLLRYTVPLTVNWKLKVYGSQWNYSESSRHPVAQFVCSPTVWFMQKVILETFFFFIILTIAPHWRNPPLCIDMTIHRRPFKDPAGSSSISPFNSEAETWAGQAEWRKPEVVFHLLLTWLSAGARCHVSCGALRKQKWQVQGILSDSPF